MSKRFVGWCLSFMGALLALAGCKKTDEAAVKTDAPETSASAVSTPHVLPVSSASISKNNNPSGEPRYTGPTGAVAGVVRFSGDQVPELPRLKSRIPLGKCLTAHKVHGSLVREGENRAVADVLVAVTGYDGYVVPRTMTQEIESRDCAFDRRTIAMTFGQTLEVKNLGPEAVAPQLIGSTAKALLMAIPGGEPISLFPHQPGHYRLVDRSHDFATAEVYVLSYPTTDVTDTQGKFRIEGIPVGKAKLSALLPQTGQELTKEVNVEAGETLQLDLQLPFNKDEHIPKHDATSKKEP